MKTLSQEFDARKAEIAEYQRVKEAIFRKAREAEIKLETESALKAATKRHESKEKRG